MNCLAVFQEFPDEFFFAGQQAKCLQPCNRNLFMAWVIPEHWAIYTFMNTYIYIYIYVCVFFFSLSPSPPPGV